MASRTSKAVRAQVKKSARSLKTAVAGVAAAAREVAKKEGATKSVTIVKGVTTSKDKPTRIVIRK
jgi:hypothetical protein